MQISENGLQLIEHFEGLVLHVYNDVVGKPTIGYGHLLKEGEEFPTGINQGIAEDLLRQDVAIAEADVNKHALNINQNQFDALVDFAYNLGGASLATLLSHGLDQIPVQILRWNKAGGKVVPGLTTRRQAELELFRTPVQA